MGPTKTDKKGQDRLFLKRACVGFENLFSRIPFSKRLAVIYSYGRFKAVFFSPLPPCFRLHILREKRIHMKKTVCVVCLIFLCLLPFPHGLEADVSDPPPAIVINGRAVASDVAPLLIDGRTLVPLRLISESFGMEVEWQADSGLIHLTCPSGDWLTFAIGSTEIRSSCGTGQMNIAPLICQGRAMVPLRVIGECFGLEVAWEPGPAGKAGHVILNGNTAAGRLHMPVHLGKSSQGNLLADDKLKHMGFS